MGETFSLALVGTGVFAHNLDKVFTGGGCQVEFFVDEIRTGSHLGRPVHRAVALDPQMISGVDKFIVAISQPEYRQAALDRLRARGVPSGRIIAMTDDHILPVLSLIFADFGMEAARYLTGADCNSVFDLERHFYGAGWEAARQRLDPTKKTIAFCFYGRGGGFRRHLRGLIPRLRERFNLLALMDEKLAGEGFEIPELFMGPDTACRLGRDGLPAVDLCLTAHFIPCSPPDKPKVNFLHTSFDFVLEPDWIIDRLATADPHYIFASTRATLEWMDEMARRRPLDTRLVLIPGGYTRLDDNLAHAASYRGPVDSLIYAPTLSLNAMDHHELTYSAPWGAEILQGLLDAFPQYEVIFRPHPNDLQLVRDGRDDALARPLRASLELCERHPRCHLDGSKTFYMDSYNRSQLMVSDTSSTAYTYALTTCRPVLFFSPHDDQVRGLFQETSAFIRDRERVGRVVGSVAEMTTTAQAMIGAVEHWREEIQAYRREVCFNPGRTEEYFAANIDFILTGRRHSDWQYFNWSSDPTTD